MSITDELRHSIEEAEQVYGCECKHLLALADRIDAEHEEALSQAYMDVSDSEWVRLPKDADGVPIHVGDVLTDDAEFESEGKVVRLMFENEGWLVGFDERVKWAEPSIHEWHHYHEPTVEDMLREFALAVCKDDALTIRKGVVEEYAAKLRLAKEE